MAKIPVILLATGSSRRMDQPKQLQKYQLLLRKYFQEKTEPIVGIFHSLFYR